MGAESPKEECGLFGVWAPGDDVARLTYFGLFAQQHRGQESAGIAVSDRTNILVYKDLGLVSQVFTEATLTTLHGDLAVADRDACRFLTPVLLGEQSEVGEAGHVLARGPDPEQPAFILR